MLVTSGVMAPVKNNQDALGTLVTIEKEPFHGSAY